MRSNIYTINSNVHYLEEILPIFSALALFGAQNVNLSVGQST